MRTQATDSEGGWMSSDGRPIWDVIARYATQKGWVPIGWREWCVGQWAIAVNGTRKPHKGVPPFHARVVHEDIIAIMVVHPSGGVVVGWDGAEDDFLRTMRRALAKLSVARDGIA